MSLLAYFGYEQSVDLRTKFLLAFRLFMIKSTHVYLNYLEDKKPNSKTWWLISLKFFEYLHAILSPKTKQWMRGYEWTDKSMSKCLLHTCPIVSSAHALPCKYCQDSSNKLQQKNKEGSVKKVYKTTMHTILQQNCITGSVCPELDISSIFLLL